MKKWVSFEKYDDLLNKAKNLQELTAKCLAYLRLYKHNEDTINELSNKLLENRIKR